MDPSAESEETVVPKKIRLEKRVYNLTFPFEKTLIMYDQDPGKDASIYTKKVNITGIESTLPEEDALKVLEKLEKLRNKSTETVADDVADDHLDERLRTAFFFAVLRFAKGDPENEDDNKVSIVATPVEKQTGHWALILNC